VVDRAEMIGLEILLSVDRRGTGWLDVRRSHRCRI
jgi:hypothetical protein